MSTGLLNGREQVPAQSKERDAFRALPPRHEYRGFTRNLIKIGSKYKFSEVQVQHWNIFAQNADLSEAQTRKRILALARLLPPTARKLQSDKKFSFADNAVVERIITLLEQRCALTIRRFTEISSEDHQPID